MNCKDCAVEHNKEETCKICKSIENYKTSQMNNLLYLIMWIGIIVLGFVGLILFLNWTMGI